MWLISGHLLWIPLYLTIIIFLIKKFGKKVLLVLPVVILSFAFADLISNEIKHTVLRYRPTHNLMIQDVVHVVNDYRGGKYGFVSSHAANTFSVATISILFLYRNYYSLLLLLWPILVSYSRIYLGVHYPADIIGGAITGVVVAVLMYWVFLFAEKKIFPQKRI
jgi:undecaprenyl-diphosphatase